MAADDGTTGARNAGRTTTWWPRVGVRTQLHLAAIMWMIGAGILLVRGLGYLYYRQAWHAWALAVGLALGVLKARFMLDRAATAAVARIRHRGRAWVLGFFSVRAWALVAVMMGAGMVLRRIVVRPDVIGAGILGAVYIGIGTALVLADRIFWRAVLRPGAVPTDPPGE